MKSATFIRVAFTTSCRYLLSYYHFVPLSGLWNYQFGLVTGGGRGGGEFREKKKHMRFNSKAIWRIQEAIWKFSNLGLGTSRKEKYSPVHVDCSLSSCFFYKNRLPQREQLKYASEIIIQAFKRLWVMIDTRNNCMNFKCEGVIFWNDFARPIALQLVLFSDKDSRSGFIIY